jgi:hypothetical protein
MSVGDRLKNSAAKAAGRRVVCGTTEVVPFPCACYSHPEKSLPDLPNSAGIHRHHGLTGFATESLPELRHVLDYAVRPELPR